MRGRGWRKWRKWVALTAVAGMLTGQTGVVSVWAEEGRESSINAGAVQEYAPGDEACADGIASVSGGNEEEPGATDGVNEDGGIDSETAEEIGGSNVAGGNDAAGKDDAAEGSGAVEKDEVIQGSDAIDLDQGEGMLTEDQMEIQAEYLTAGDTAGNIASGKSGDITWVIDANGKLTVEGTGDLSEGDWSAYREQITSAVINVSGMTNATGLFSGCSNMTSVDLSGFDTSNVTNMRKMFYGCKGLTSVDLSKFDTSNVTDMGWMFDGCNSLKSIDMSSFDTNKVTHMDTMFAFCNNLASLDLSGVDTSNVGDMSYMFSGCSSLTSLNVSGFATGNVINMGYMFSDCSSLKSVDVSGFDTGNVRNMSHMFSSCSGLPSLDVSGFATGNVEDMSYMFSGCSSLTSVDVSGFDTSKATNMSYMFAGCFGFKSGDFGKNNGLHWEWDEGTKTIIISGDDEPDVKWMWGLTEQGTPDWWNTAFNPNVERIKFRNCIIRNSMSEFFATLKNLKEVDFDGLTVENLQSMSSMFFNCTSLKNLDMRGIDTAQVTDMSGMFWNCYGLENLNISGFDTSQVTNISGMFNECGISFLDLSSFNLNKVTNAEGMFARRYEGGGLMRLKTPHILGSEPIDLEETFLDPNGRETQYLTSDFCDTILTIKGLTKPESVKYTVVGVIGGRNVTFNTNTEDTVIYYSAKTSSLTTSDACVNPGETVLFENFYGTIYAKAYSNGQWSNVSRLILKIPVVSKPTITSKDGVVTIKTTTPDSYIYYTTDGSTPSPTNGTRLAKSGGSFTVPANCTVRAIAVRSCFTNSEIVSAKVAARKLGAPSFAVKGVIGGREVTFNTTETKGEIYYSFTTSNITTKDRHVKPGEKVLFQNYYGTVYAKTYVNGQWSNVARLILKIPMVNKPTITAAGAGKVKISTSTPNCAIYYTTDGSTPSPTNGTRINSSSSIVTVGSGKTVKAIAVRSCFTNSEVATYRQK